MIKFSRKKLIIIIFLILTPIGIYFLKEKQEKKYLYDILKKSELVDSLIYDAIRIEKNGKISGKVFENKEGFKRIEANIKEENLIIFVSNQDETVYLLNVEENILRKEDFNEVKKEFKVILPWIRSYTYMQKYNPVIVGEEILENDKECIVIEYIAPSWEEETTYKKIWIWKKHGFPIKSIITLKNGEEIISIAENLQVVEIPDEMFEIPKSLEIADIEI